MPYAHMRCRVFIWFIRDVLIAPVCRAVVDASFDEGACCVPGDVVVAVLRTRSRHFRDQVQNEIYKT